MTSCADGSYRHAAASAGIPLQTDGEFAGELPATVEIVPDALTLLMPPSYVKKCGAREHRTAGAPL